MRCFSVYMNLYELQNKTYDTNRCITSISQKQLSAVLWKKCPKIWYIFKKIYGGDLFSEVPSLTFETLLEKESIIVVFL